MTENAQFNKFLTGKRC